MLQKDYSRELIDLVQDLARGEILNKPTITAICISVEEKMGPLGITPYNIRQIVNMEDNDMSMFDSGQIAEDIIERNYNNGPFIKTYKYIKEKDYIKKSRLLGSSTDFLENMKSYLESYRPHDIFTMNIKKRETNKNKVIALTDLHLGKQNSELIIDRLTEIVSNIINDTVSNVDIFCMGDLVETLVQGGMHEGQIEEMDGTYGFDLLMKTVQIFETFLIELYEAGITVTFYGLSGNHDRMTKDREGDKKRLGGLVIYELIKRGVQKYEGIEVKIIQNEIYNTDIDGIRYIIAHGDMAKIPTRAGSDIAWIHGDNSKSHNIIMYGHLHNVAITEEKKITKIGLPGLAGKDQYATKTLDLHSEPAYIEITHNKHGSADIIIKRLQNG